MIENEDNYEDLENFFNLANLELHINLVTQLIMKKIKYYQFLN